MAKRQPKGAKKYEPILTLADDFEFDDLFKVAINHKQPKEKKPPKRRRPTRGLFLFYIPLDRYLCPK